MGDIGARPPGTGDMFLSVKGAQAGIINGEAKDAAHKDEIEVLSWSWGMEGKSSLGGGTIATGRATLRALKIVKRFDKSSTALMKALRHNEPIKEAILTLRKAGKTQLEYLKIKIQDGRVTGLEVQAGDPPGSSSVTETITLAFNKIQIDYIPQGEDGQKLGGTTFEDFWAPAGS